MSEKKRKYTMESRVGGRRTVVVPATWQAKCDRANNGETFAVEFQDENGDLTMRVQDVSAFYRDDAEYRQPVAPQPIPTRYDYAGSGRPIP